MKVKKCNFYKIVSAVTALSLMLGMLTVSTVSAEISATGVKTIAENFSSTVMLEHQKSTATTGMEGFFENDTSQIIYPKNTGVYDGAYRMCHSGQNQGWLMLQKYDEATNTIVNSKEKIGNFYTPYKFTGTGDTVPTALKSFKGTLYSTNFTSDNNAPFIAYNYIDNGNVDAVTPFIWNGAVYFRTFSIRTETVEIENVGSYKKIYGLDRLDQPSVSGISVSDLQTTTINSTTYYALDFEITYGTDAVTVSFSSGEKSVSQTFKDSLYSNNNISNCIDSSDTKTVASFGHNAASKATAVGFLTFNETCVDNLSLTYEYNKDADELAQDFRNTHSEILAMDIGSVTEANTDAYTAALSDYNSLGTEVQALLTTEKAQLDAITQKLSDLIVEQFYTAHSEALALTAETVSTDNVSKAYAALTGFKELDTATQAAVTARYNGEHNTVYAALSDFFKALCDKVYYNDDGALVYEDFSGYTKADGAWGDTEYSTLTKRGDKRINSVEYVMSFNTAALATGFNSSPFYAYKDTEKDQSFNFQFSSDTSTGWKNKVFFNALHVNNLRGIYAGSHISSDVLDPAQYPTLTLRVRYSYDYSVFDGEAQKFPYGISYESNYIKVNFQYSFDELPDRVYKTVSNYMAILPNEGETVNDLFSVGFNVNSLPSGSTLTSFSVTYYDPSISPEFEEFAGTYNKSNSNVSLEDKDQIVAAMNFYATLTDAQKTKYASNYQNLQVLQEVVTFIESVNAVVVTPKALTELDALKATYASAGYTNTNVDSALAAKYTAADVFRPVIAGATIRTSSNPNEQDLRFISNIPAAPEGWRISEIGVVLLPQNILGSSELTKATASVAVAKKEYAEGVEAPTKFTAELGKSAQGDARCARDICARTYVVYTNGTESYEYYSTNNTENNISNGTAVRSVYGVARSMAKAIIGTTEYGTVIYTEKITATTDIATEDIVGADVLEFVSKNVDVIKAFVLANQ